jgi:hypothetical protein
MCMNTYDILEVNHELRKQKHKLLVDSNDKRKKYIEAIKIK